MRRRYPLVFALAAVLIVPGLALALPRPNGAAQTAPETVVGSPLSIDSRDSVGVSSPVLTSGRAYRLEVVGTWKPTTSSTNNADAAFETTDGSNWSHTGKGLLIGPTNYAGATSPITAFRSDHKYSISLTGRGIAENIRVNDPIGYADNSGSLTVTVYQIAVVTYQVTTPVTIDPQALGLGQVTLPIPTATASVPAEGGQTISPIPVGGNVPQVGTVQFVQGSQGGSPVICLVLTIQGLPSTTLGCVLNPGGLVPGTGPIPIGGASVGPVTVCSAPPCAVPSVSPTTKTVGGSVSQSLPAGATVSLVFRWSADTTHIFRTFVDDGTGSNYIVAPFDARIQSERDWYQTNFGNLDGEIAAKIIRTDGAVVFDQTLVSISGIGQVLEAMFETKVAGN
ncbi:MAG: hypothetical protein LC723_12520 [Actinobacteria bacterium]|nr:hypothetical protein [Actinomycetota bacterium]